MKLTYRGVSYESKVNSVETVETNIFAKYRGSSYNYRRSMKCSKSESKLLKYRGLTYNSSDLNAIPQPVETQPASMSVSWLKWLKIADFKAIF